MQQPKFQVGDLVDLRDPYVTLNAVTVCKVEFWPPGTNYLEPANPTIFTTAEGEYHYTFPEHIEDGYIEERFLYPHNPPADESWEEMRDKILSLTPNKGATV